MAIRVNGRADNPTQIGYSGNNVTELYYGGKLIWPAEIDILTDSNVTVVVNVNLVQTSAGTWTYTWTTNYAIPSANPVTVSLNNGASVLTLSGEGNSTPTSAGVTTSAGTAVTYTKTENTWIDANNNTATTQTTVNVNTVSYERVYVPFILNQQETGYWAYFYSTEIPVANSIQMSINGTSFTVTGGTGSTLTSVQTAVGTAPTSTGITGGTYYVAAGNKVYNIDPAITQVKPYSNTPYLNISPTYVETSADGYESTPIRITSNVSWTVTYSDSWLVNSLSPSGSGNGSTYFYATKNTGAERSGIVTISGGGLVRNCAVVQEAAPAIALSSGAYYYTNQPYTGRTISDTVYITGDTEWEVSEITNMTVTPSQGVNGTSIQMTIPANNSTSSQMLCSAVFRLKNHTSINQRVQAWVSPAPVIELTPSISVTSNGNVAYNAQSAYVTVTANTTWQINSSLLSGITVSQCSPTAGTSGSTQVEIRNLPTNTSYDSAVTYQFGATTTADSNNVSDICQISKAPSPDIRPTPSLTLESNPTSHDWNATSYNVIVTPNYDPNRDYDQWKITLLRNGVPYNGFEDQSEGGYVSTLYGAGTATQEVLINQNSSTSQTVEWKITGETLYSAGQTYQNSPNVTATTTSTQAKKYVAPVQGTKYVVFTRTSYQYSPTGGTYNFTVSANTNWVIYAEDIIGYGEDNDVFVDISGMEEELTGTSGTRTVTISVPAFNGDSNSLEIRNNVIPIQPIQYESGYNYRTNTLTITQPEKPYIRIGSGSSTVSAPSASLTSVTRNLGIFSNSPWSASTSLDWVSVSPATGVSTDSRITFTFGTNTSTSARTGTITFTTMAPSPHTPQTSVTYTVTQPGAAVPPITPSLYVSPTSSSINSSMNSVNYTVTANTTWSVSKSASWITLPSTTGQSTTQEGVTFTVNCAQNTSSNSRTGTVTFTTTYTGNNKTSAVTITQAGAQYYAGFTSGEMRVSPNVTSVTIHVSANTDWHIGEYDSALSLSSTYGGSGLSAITVTMPMNQSTFITKSYYIPIIMDNGDVNQSYITTYIIRQNPVYNGDVTAETEYTFSVTYLNDAFEYYIFNTNGTPTSYGTCANVEIPWIHYADVSEDWRLEAVPYYNTPSGGDSGQHCANNVTYYLRYYNTLTNTWSSAYSFVWKDAENITVNNG